MIDGVHEIEKPFGFKPVLDHQPAHRSPVATVIVLLHAKRLLWAQIEEVRDEVANPYVDLLPQVDVMGVERVVEIEHPGVDMVEAARCLRARERGGHDHGSRSRSVERPLPGSTMANPIISSPLAPQSM